MLQTCIEFSDGVEFSQIMAVKVLFQHSSNTPRGDVED